MSKIACSLSDRVGVRPTSVMDILQKARINVSLLHATFLVGFTTVIFLFWYSTRRHSYWKKRGIPYVKPLPFFGSVLDYILKPCHFTDLERFNKHGRLYGYYEGHNALLSVSEPEIIGNILVNDFHVFTGRKILEAGDEILESLLPILRGEDWKRVRTILSPSFTTGSIRKMMSIFEDCSRTLAKNLRDASEKGEPINAKSIYCSFTMDTIASTAFSTEIDSHSDPNNMFVKTAKQIFSRKITWRMLLFALLPRIRKLFGVSVLPPKSIKFLTDTVLQTIEERKKTGQTRNDFLQFVMDAIDEATEKGKLDVDKKDYISENYGKVDSDQGLDTYDSRKYLSHHELVAQCVNFFLAGYDTIISTLSFASYLLALNPDLQEKLSKEVDEALRTTDGELTYEAVQNMKYLDNVVAETLRLYPPFSRLGRRSDEDYKLGDTGLTVPKGMLVTIPIYALHRDPELFPNPEKFDPDRFSPEERAKQIPFSYLPFGAGPRNCIAMQFGLMEVKVCLVHVLSNFRIKECSTTRVPLEYDSGLGFLQPKNITLFMEIRKDSVKAL